MAGEFITLRLIFRVICVVAALYVAAELMTGGVTRQLFAFAIFCFLVVWIAVEMGWGGQFGEWWRLKAFHYWTHKRGRGRRKH